MPPKAKFTRRQIAMAGLKIVRTDGMENLTARILGERLGSSVCPIFTVFENMEDVEKEVLSLAKETYNGYTLEGLSKSPAFKAVGEAYIRFAKEERKLFQLLFMSEKLDTLTIDERLHIDDHYEDIVSSIEYGYGLTREKAHKLYRHMWIYAHGIATLIATNVCMLSEDEIDSCLSEVFIASLAKIKSGK